MPTISVPQEFFVSERDNIYSDWRSSFWRELLSNAMDAGSGRIHIRTRFNDDGMFVTDLVDTGCGMDRNVIEDVYMRLGASTKKEDKASVGGFGRARILTCFSQEKYKIRTSNLLVSGSGSTFDIQETEKSVRGCAITIQSDPKHAVALQRGLLSVLRQSSLRSAITLDLCKARPCGYEMPRMESAETAKGEAQAHPRFKAWSHKGRKFSELADEDGKWADLFVSEGSTAVKNRAIVRVNGLSMYEEHLSAPVQVTVDLSPDRARSILTASRDSIRGIFRSELQRVFSKIAADRNSTFRERSAEPQSSILQNKDGIAGNPIEILRKSETLTHSLSESQGLDDLRRTQDERRPDADFGSRAEGAPSKDATVAVDKSKMRIPFALRIDHPNSDQRSSISRYRPETWMEGKGEGRSAELLHAAWTAACHVALRTLHEKRPDIGGENFICGFVIDRNVAALHVSVEGVRHGLLLNPMDDEGRMKYRTSDPDSMKRMATLAIHEVTHCLHDWHDESFAGTMTDLMASIRDKDMERAIKEEMDLARTWIAERETKPQDDAPQP